MHTAHSAWILANTMRCGLIMSCGMPFFFVHDNGILESTCGWAVLFHTILSPNFVTTSRAAMPLLIVHGNACSGFAFQDKGYTTLLCWLTRVEDFHRHVAQKYLDKP